VHASLAPPPNNERQATIQKKLVGGWLVEWMDSGFDRESELGGMERESDLLLETEGKTFFRLMRRQLLLTIHLNLL
jgi:hypothetical protein